jgi:transcriptional regulator GlxA family with amidase domain
MALSIGIAIFDGAEELDFAGPWEVLAFWSQYWPDDHVSVFTVARDEGPVTCAKGLRVLPDHTWDSAPSIDVLVFPGGQGTRVQVKDEAVHEWLRKIAGSGALMTSVCTGALVYAGAGFLKDRPATTHWENFDELIAIDDSIKPDKEARFVDDGDVITAAGVSAGIDMALHLVARLHSTERAKQVKRGIQYDPAPPV